MLALVAIMVVLLVWGVVAGRLARWNVTAPLAMVLAGMLLTAGEHPVFHLDFDTGAGERGVEIVLAVLLFVDATEVQGGMFGGRPALTARLLLIGLPLSLAAAWLVGYLIVPYGDLWLLAALATVVVPTDLGPAGALIRDLRVPSRLRHLLNVESGLNDGAVAPVFLLCLAVAHANDGAPVDFAAITRAVPSVLVAVAVGAVVGWSAGWVLRWAYARDWTQPSALRLAVVALPLMAYGLAIVLGGNGFIAAFVAGVLFEPATRVLPHDALHFTEDVGTLLGLGAWFAFGQLIDATLAGGTHWWVVVYALLAISVVRVVPVMVSLLGTDVRWVDRLFLGWLGPRGLASIVFGLLATIDLASPENGLILQVMVVTVLASVVLHGLSYGPIARAYGRSGRAAREDDPAAGGT